MINYIVNVNNYELAKKIAANIQVGNHFLFAEEAKWLNVPHNDAAADLTAQRLQLKADKKVSSAAVKAIVPGSEFSLAGMTIGRDKFEPGYFCAVIPDRDLYKAEQDTINLLSVFPSVVAHQTVSLRVSCNGDVYETIDIHRSLLQNNGVVLNSLSMLLAGQYSAQLVVDDQEIGDVANFIVAQYQLAPFDGQLITHTLDPQSDTLSFELRVSSYEMPWELALDVVLIEHGTEQQRLTLQALGAGKFSGAFTLTSSGPFHLRLIASDDASRMCEIALPGSGQAQRQTTVISELGAEVRLSMLPVPQSIPVRGGFIQQGAQRDMAIEINQCVTNKPALLIHQKTAVLAVLTWDMLENNWHEYTFTNLDVGDEVALTRSSNMMMVFVGGWINDQPFEGYATVLSADGLNLKLEAKSTARPGDTLEVKINLNSNRPLPVYLNIRDSRLTSSVVADNTLGQCLKQHIEIMANNYSDYQLTSLADRPEFSLPVFYDSVKMYSRSAPPSNFALDDTLMFSAGDFETTRSLPLSKTRSIQRSRKNKKVAEIPMLAEEGLADEQGQDQQPRGKFPDSLFCGLVYVQNQETIKLKLGDNLGRIRIDAFVYDDGNWCATNHDFVVDQAVRADLDFPPVVQLGDEVYGRIRAQTASGNAQVKLFYNNEEVNLNLSAMASDQSVKTPLEIDLKVQPGEYLLQVTDPGSHEMDSIKIQVSEPGKTKSILNALQLLQAGESINLDSYPGALKIELLAGFKQVTEKLVGTTANYGHLCCEQTAAKILAACAMYIGSEDIKTRQDAEKIILAGVVREQLMITDKGFKMYPDGDHHSEYYSKLAVQYLWQLQALQQYKGLSDSLKSAIEQGLQYADRAAKYHHLSRFTELPETMAQAWMLACEQPQHPAIRQFIDNSLNLTGSTPRLKQDADLVYQRTAMAYAAACLLKQDDLKNAIKLANHVMREISESGMLYSTVDSVALIAMLSMFKSHIAFQGNPKLRINGQITDPESLISNNSTAIETIEVLEGAVLVQINQIVEHDWLESTAAMKVSHKLYNDKNDYSMGELVNLDISLDEGYVNGDLVYINLPAGLSWIQGGGRVKQFSLDFAGKPHIRIPLLVTSKIQGKQHFAILVRNMFSEERVACPGLIKVA